jgi:hypothetical protein
MTVFPSKDCFRNPKKCPSDATRTGKCCKVRASLRQCIRRVRSAAALAERAAGAVSAPL